MFFNFSEAFQKNSHKTNRIQALLFVVNSHKNTQELKSTLVVFPASYFNCHFAVTCPSLQDSPSVHFPPISHHITLLCFKQISALVPLPNDVSRNKLLLHIPDV